MLLLVVTGSLQQVAIDYAQRLVRDRIARESAVEATPQPVNSAEEQRTRYQAAPPTASGAYPAYPLNHTFDADPITLGAPANADFETAPSTVGTAPTNFDFATAPADQGTQLTNFGFATGDFTGWTTESSLTTIQGTGGPDGAWARLAGSPSTLTTAAFTPESDAQVVTFDLGQLSTTSGNTLAVYALTGATYGTSTEVGYFTCANCNQWSVGTVNITPYRGQPFKLRFTRISGTIGIDRARKQVVLPGYEATGSIRRLLDGTDPFASSSGTLTSPAFTVDSAAQFGTVRFKGMTAGYTDSAYLYVLSGTGYATSTRLTVQADDAWFTYRFNVGAWLGGSIKLRLDVISGRVGIDDVDIQRVDFAGWTATGAAFPVTGEAEGTAARFGDTMTSAAVALPADAQQLTIRYKTGDTGLYWELLTGPTFTTVVSLSGGTLPASAAWRTAKAGVSGYAGQTVKVRVKTQLQGVTVDNVGVIESVVPGWKALNNNALAVGQDATGTYVTSRQTNGAVSLQGSVISPGVVNDSSSADGRSYVIALMVGPGTSSLVRLSYSGVGPSASSSVLVSTASNPGVLRLVRFTVYDSMPTTGTFFIQATGGARVYSIGDNLALQRLSEPYSLKAGVGQSVDTSTGAYGMSATDLTVAAGPMPMVVTRTYAAHADRLGPLGYRWRHSYMTQLAIDTSGSAGVVWGDGREEYFEWSSTSQTFSRSDSRTTGTLTKVSGQAWTYEYATKEKSVFFFAANGDLISFKDANGNFTTVYRNMDGTVDYVQDPGLRTIDFAYDGGGRLTSITGPSGERVQYGYDAAGDLAWVEKLIDGTTTPETETRTEYSYSRHRLTQIRERRGDDPAGAPAPVLTIGLDAYNRVLSETDAEGQETIFAWQTAPGGTAADGVTTVTDPLGKESGYYFDAWGRTTHTRSPNDDVRQFIFDVHGNLTAIVDPVGEDYVIGYTAARDPNAITDPLNRTTAIDWDAVKHKPTKVTDARGTVTQMAYDSAGNLRQVTVDPSDADPAPELDLVTRFEVNGAGLVTKQVVDPQKDWLGVDRGGTRLNLVTAHTYDGAGNLTSTTLDPDDATTGYDGLNLTTSWTYDGSGRLTSETDPDGRTVSYVYDMLGRIITVRHVRDGVNEDVDLVYDIVGNIVLLEDALGHQWQWFYDGRDRVIGKEDPAGNEWAYGYDDNDNLTAVTDPLGHVTAYGYDEQDRITTRTIDPNDPSDTDPELNLVTSQTYDAAGNVDTVTDPRGYTWRYGHDENKRLTDVTLPNTPVGGVYDVLYDAVGNVTTVENPYSQQTTSTYDAAGRLEYETTARGTVTKHVHDAAGRETAVIEDYGTGAHLNLTTTTTYDRAGRVASVTDPKLHTTAYTYDGAGNVLTITDAALGVTEYAYDVYGRLTSITDPLDRTTTFVYDAAGRHTETIDPSSQGWGFAYDARDLLETATDPLGNATVYGHDDAGRLGSERTARGFTTVYGYDAADRVTSITDADGQTLAYTYDASGNVATVTNPRGYATTLTYDGLGNLLSETDALGQERSYRYDAMGRLDVATDARLITVDLAYDEEGNLLSKTPSVGGAVSYSYDALGRLDAMTDPGGVTDYGYDAAGNVTSVASPQGDIAYAYDALDRRESMTLPGSKTVGYSYDAASQLVGMTDWTSADAYAYAYTDVGLLDTVVRPNEVTSNFDYDNASRLITVEHNAGADLLARYAYDLDEDGNREGVGVTGSAATNRTEAYTYDALDRLETASYGAGSLVSYTYDANGNRLTLTSGGLTTSYTYDQLDRLTATTGAFVSQSGYDANGNRTSVSYGPGGVDGTDTFAYDWNNRLEAAEVDGVPVEYAYAADDLRTERTQGTSTAPYLWDRLTALPTMVGDGTARFVHGPGGVQSEITGSTPLRPLQDGLGSSRVWTDATGAAVGSADYDAWGMGQAAAGTTGVFGWTGEQRDPTSNLVYLRARDYSPGTGRFAQRDTVQPNAAGTKGYNPYAYANNVPTTLTDAGGNYAGAYDALTLVSIEQVALGAAGGDAASLYVFGGIQTFRTGLGVILLELGFSLAVAFALLAIVFFVVLVLYEVNSWRQEHGCTFPDLGVGRAYGWIKTHSEAGGSKVALGVAGVATGACAAVLAFPSLFTAEPLIQNCGVEKPTACAVEYLTDVVVETAIDVVDPYGIASFAYDAASAEGPCHDRGEPRRFKICGRFRFDEVGKNLWRTKDDFHKGNFKFYRIVGPNLV